MYGTIVEQSGPFAVTAWSGRNVLYMEAQKIAECINGDYQERFGGMDGWLKTIMKRSATRLNKIAEQKQALSVEEAHLNRQINMILELE